MELQYNGGDGEPVGGRGAGKEARVSSKSSDKKGVKNSFTATHAKTIQCICNHGRNSYAT